MNFSVQVSEFLCFVSAEKALSLNTRLAYEKDLQQYFEFCSRRGVLFDKATLKDLRDFLASLRREELSARSIARKASALKQFYKFLLREGKVETNPADLLSATVKTKRLPKHLSVEEMFKLIAAAKGDDEAEVRDRALFELWYATGSRVSEVASVTVEAIDWDDGTVKIKGKGGRERLVPVSRVALQWCERYRVIRHEWVRKHELKETKVFFLTRQGKGFTRQGIWKTLKKYALRAGISKNVWPHMIRHSFATHVLQGGADLRAVQELLGHRSISTTEVYTHLDIENLKVMQQKYHPRS